MSAKLSVGFAGEATAQDGRTGRERPTPASAYLARSSIPTHSTDAGREDLYPIDWTAGGTGDGWSELSEYSTTITVISM